MGKSNARKGRVLEDWVTKAVAKEAAAREKLVEGLALVDKLEKAREELAAAILPVAPWGFEKFREDIEKINATHSMDPPLDAEKIMTQLRAIVAAMPDDTTTTEEE